MGSFHFSLYPNLTQVSPTPVFLPGKSHEQKSLASYSSRGWKSWTRLNHHLPSFQGWWPLVNPLIISTHKWLLPNLDIYSIFCITLHLIKTTLHPCCFSQNVYPIAVNSLKVLRTIYTPFWVPTVTTKCVVLVMQNNKAQ